MKKNLPANFLIQKDHLSDILSSFDFTPIFFFYALHLENKLLKNDILTRFKISFLITGTIKVSCNNITYELGPKSILLVPPSILHTIECISKEPVTFYTIYFDLPLQQRMKFIELFKLQQIQCIPSFLSDFTIKFIEDKYNGFLAKEPLTFQSIKILIDNCMLKLLRVIQNNIVEANGKYRHQYSEEKTVLKCIAYLDDNIYYNVTVDDLCGHCAISQSYLYRCFISYLNTSPKQFITTYRLNKIEVDLLQSSKSISEIAIQYGYSSVYAFSNSFKSFYHISPKDFRKQLSNLK
ncbi:AraC family transcriptional regulator [Anaerorhabdus sp.]|uniref:AraC family transcriptional regulator n=1 Tax=Anaerorhabdus sp. TaxID=1872524 RepID=UPI002FCB6C04